MPTEEQYIENHPFYHDWSFARDEVVKARRGGAPLEVKREEKCANCPTLRLSVVEIVWRNGRPDELSILRRWYRYQPNTVILRESKSDWYLDMFMKTTDIEYFRR